MKGTDQYIQWLVEQSDGVANTCISLPPHPGYTAQKSVPHLQEQVASVLIVESPVWEVVAAPY
jgi:hypothetical protein